MRQSRAAAVAETAEILEESGRLLTAAHARLMERHPLNPFTAFEFGYAIRDLPDSDNELTLATALIAGRWVTWFPQIDTFQIVTLDERAARLAKVGANVTSAMDFEAKYLAKWRGRA